MSHLSQGELAIIGNACGLLRPIDVSRMFTNSISHNPKLDQCLSFSERMFTCLAFEMQYISRSQATCVHPRLTQAKPWGCCISFMIICDDFWPSIALSIYLHYLIHVLLCSCWAVSPSSFPADSNAAHKQL